MCDRKETSCDQTHRSKNCLRKGYYGLKHYEIMVEILSSPLSIAEIAQSEEYRPLVLPFIFPLLAHPSEAGKWIALEARIGEKLVGLTLSEVYDEKVRITAQLFSFVVDPLYRQKGIGKRLFAATQKFLIEEEKIAYLRFLYTQEDASSPAIEKIKNALDWPLSRTLIVRCHYDFPAFNPRWLHHSYRLPRSMNIFSWKKISQKDRDQIKYLVKQKGLSPYLNPLENENIIDLPTSVGLYHHGKLSGWSITQKTDPSTLCYSILYVDETLLNTGYGIQLLVESIRRHKQTPTRFAIFEVNAREIDPSWINFIKKRLFPLALKIEHIKEAITIFNPPL